MNHEDNTPMNQGLESMIRAHLWYGFAGLSIGLIAALAAINVGPAFMTANPFFTVLALAMVGTISVSMLGGLLTFIPTLDSARARQPD